MPRIGKAELLKNKVIGLFDYDKTRLAVLSHFDDYVSKKEMLDVIESAYNSPQGNDNMGIFSGKISDPTAINGTKGAEYKTYTEKVEETLRPLKLKLTADEKIILEKSILTRHIDDEVALALSMDKRNIYHKKKSCYIKVALYYGIEVYK